MQIHLTSAAWFRPVTSFYMPNVDVITRRGDHGIKHAANSCVVIEEVCESLTERLQGVLERLGALMTHQPN
jgi:hypothetical protein